MKIFSTRLVTFGLFFSLVLLAQQGTAQVETQITRTEGSIDAQPLQLEKVVTVTSEKVEFVIDTVTKRVMEAPAIENVVTVNLMAPNTSIDTPIIRNSHVKIPKEVIMKGARAPEDGTKVNSVNDLICNAIVIGDDDCYTQTDGNSNCTSDYYGGCVPPNNPSIWFKTTIVGPNDYLRVDVTCVAGRLMEVLLCSGTCANPVIVASECQWSPFSFQFYDLVPGDYFLMFATQPGVGNEIPAFTICFDQMIAPVLITGPEQDCAGAIPVCDLQYIQTNSYGGYWVTDEIPNYQTCLLGGENNSVWYVFTPQTNGNLSFTINTVKDYDWAIYNLTAIGGCSAIPSSVPALCNYSDDYGITGATTTISAVPRSNIATDPPMMNGMAVTAGNTYVLIVDNYTGDGTGYTLDFATSTASIADRPPATGAYPSMTSGSVNCTSNSITVNMSEYVQCITIRPADFVLTNTTTATNFTANITSVTGVNCATNELTNQLIITHDGTLTTGHYELTINAGPILADKCGNIIQVPGIISFDYLGNLTLTATPATICYGASTSLDANGADGAPSLTTYTLSPGGLTNNTNGIFNGLSPVVNTNYIVSATYAGCTKTATATVIVEGNILTTLNPGTTTVCDFTTPAVLTANTAINGAACGTCTYLWSTGSTTDTIHVTAPGTFTVTVTTGSGCHNGNSASATISLASAGAGGGSCDVIYVSPAGGGNGLTKTSPTTLANAISLAQCTYTVIKMQRGVYTLTDYQPVHSYVTIEGGYNNLFTTKYSDMTGNSNSTTIRRTIAGDSDNANTCTCFRVDNGANNFRIQDIRIELPGATPLASNPAHAAGVNKTNYGINMGSGCAAYNIVRCYIDAGIGSAP